jgi:Fe-S-cluster containining protein
MTIHFECTQCGKCCHNLRLTLSVDEAIAWAGRGHTVQVLAEALPWPQDPEPETPVSAYDKARSFPAMSGEIPVRIAVSLVAYHDGACPHLLPDMRCGNYEERPRICRIYPLERRPLTAWRPEERLCPPEAWTPDWPVLERGGEPAEPVDARIIEDHRRVALEDVPALTAACQDLGLDSAAFANEGLAVHTPVPAVLADALRTARDGTALSASERQWRIVTNRGATHSMLISAGCSAGIVQRGSDYLGSFPDEA